MIGDSQTTRRVLIGSAITTMIVLLVVPLVTVFVGAFAEGFGTYARALGDRDALSAILLTLVTSAIVVPLNFVFGIAAAWTLAKYDFPGRTLLTTLIDLPFSVSPVISGLLFVLIFGAQGWLGPWLLDHGVRVIFAVPGVIIATTFVTFPLVAREVLAIMQSQGSDQEEAALTLGSSGWQILWRVTLPRIRWGLVYGVILCNARAMGEFGAVSVVSGHVRGRTNTMPLHVEVLYNEYAFAASFAVASLLALLAIVTLAGKAAIEWHEHRRASESLAGAIR